MALGLGDTTALVAQIAEGAVAGALGGAVIGTLQWLVLRTRLPGARWWVAASVLAWAVGVAAGDGVGYFAAGSDLVVAPIVAASFTGIALATLRRSRQDDAPRVDALTSTAPSTRSPNG